MIKRKLRIFPVIMAVFLSFLFMLMNASCTGGRMIQFSKQAPEELNGQSLYKDVATYAKFKVHQTGTDGDHLTSRWIEKTLKDNGLKTQLKPWRLKQFFLTECTFSIGKEKIDAFPAWYPKNTGRVPLAGKLAMYNEADVSNLNGRIALAGGDFAVSANAGVNAEAEIAKKAGAIGLIVVSRGSNSGLLAAANARRKDKEGYKGPEYFQAPLPIPTVIIAEKDYIRLSPIFEQNPKAEITIRGKHNTNTQAFNVLGVLQRGEKWIVVTTPSSGWFSCGGERGAGVALFLGLARWAAKNDTQHSFIFIANSGHELDNMGAHFTLDEYLPDYGIHSKNVTAWLHLGASIANRQWEKTDEGYVPLDKPASIFFQGTQELLPYMKRAFKGIDGYRIGSGFYAGELEVIIDKAFNAFGFFGANYFFHQREDTERSTSPELLEPLAVALVDILKALDKSE